MGTIIPGPGTTDPPIPRKGLKEELYRWRIRWRIEPNMIPWVAVQVPEDALWGAQTERSRQNFTIGRELMPRALIHAYARLKKACAAVNARMGLLDDHQADLITRACDEILNGDHDGQFPLHVWQTGSGTQTNMNLNEVIASRAALLDGKTLDDKRPIHPNDHVNKSQSSNDTFPAAMHIAAVFEIHDTLLPAVERMRVTLEEKSRDFSQIIKIGRTHLQDATPADIGPGDQRLAGHGRKQPGSDSAIFKSALSAGHRRYGRGDRP